MVEGFAEARVLLTLLKSISIVLFLIFAAWDLTMEDNWLTLDFYVSLCKLIAVQEKIQTPLPRLPRLEMIFLWKSKVLFSGRLSWVISLSLYSQVNCGLMLFNVIPIWEGEFLNFDCSVSPSRRGKSRTSGWCSIWQVNICTIASFYCVKSFVLFCKE